MKHRSLTFRDFTGFGLCLMCGSSSCHGSSSLSSSSKPSDKSSSVRYLPFTNATEAKSKRQLTRLIFILCRLRSWNLMHSSEPCLADVRCNSWRECRFCCLARVRHGWWDRLGKLLCTQLAMGYAHYHKFCFFIEINSKKMYFLYKIFLLSLTVMMFGFTRKWTKPNFHTFPMCLSRFQLNWLQNVS